jgi:integrase
MPRTASGIPSYRRHKASGQAVVTLNGVDHYLGKWNTTQSKAEYNRITGEWLALGRRLPKKESESAGLLMKELIHGYHNHVKTSMPEVEVERVALALRPVRTMFGETPASEFGPMRYKAVRQVMVDKGLCVTTIKDRLGVIKRMIAWGVENEVLPGDALYRLKAVAPLRAARDGVKPARKVLPVSEADIHAILPHVSATIRAMVELQALSGMRPGEVWRITTGQIDRSEAVWIYSPTKHKTASRGKERPIPLGPKAQAILLPFLKADPDAPLFSPTTAIAERDERIRQRKADDPKAKPGRIRKKRKSKRKVSLWYTKNTYADAITRGCIRAGVPVFRPNRIRHYYGTKVRKMFGLEHAQVTLGHEKADVTQIYAERNMALARDVAQKIG